MHNIREIVCVCVSSAWHEFQCVVHNVTVDTDQNVSADYIVRYIDSIVSNYESLLFVTNHNLYKG